MQGIRDDAITQKEQHIAQVLWVAGKAVGPAGDKTIRNARCINHAKMPDAPN